MKLNKQFYKETFSKVEMSQEMKNKLMEIPNKDTKIKRKPTKKVTAILVAAAITVGSAISVYAGANLYNFYTQKDGKYAESLVLEKNNLTEPTSSTEKENNKKVMALSKNGSVIKPTFVKIKLSNLPQGFTKEENTGNILKLDYKGKYGITFDILEMSGYEEVTVSNESVIDSEVTTLNGSSVYYLEQQALGSEDVFSKDIYMYNQQYDYLIHGYIGRAVPKKVAYKVFENLKLVECEEWESHNISDWVEPVDEDTVYYEGGGYYYDPEINNYIQIGETSKVAYDPGSDIEVTVDSIELSEDLSMMDDSFKSKYLDKKGKLKPLEVKCYGGGDGVNSLSGLQKTEYLDVVYVYETVTYRNNSDTDENDFCVYQNIFCPTAKAYPVDDRLTELSEQYDHIEYDSQYVSYQWVYDDFSKSNTNSPNYINIPANGEITVHLGFFIPKDSLNDDLWISVSDGYSIDGGRASEDAVLVDIPQ